MRRYFGCRTGGYLTRRVRVNPLKMYSSLPPWPASQSHIFFGIFNIFFLLFGYTRLIHTDDVHFPPSGFLPFLHCPPQAKERGEANKKAKEERKRKATASWFFSEKDSPIDWKIRPTCSLEDFMPLHRFWFPIYFDLSSWIIYWTKSICDSTFVDVLITLKQVFWNLPDLWCVISRSRIFVCEWGGEERTTNTKMSVDVRRRRAFVERTECLSLLKSRLYFFLCFFYRRSLFCFFHFGLWYMLLRVTHQPPSPSAPPTEGLKSS